MDPLLEQFVSEARDNLSFLDAHLKDLASGDAEQINALFRAAHTLKGGAGLVGFEAVKEITHAAEDLLDAFRNHRIEYSEALLDTLYDAFDEVIELVESAEMAESIDAVEVDEAHIQALRDRIRAFLTEAEGGEQAEGEEEGAFEASFSVEEVIGLPHLNRDQLKAVVAVLPEHKPKLDAAFAQSAQLWVIELDLDEDTLKLGNDPFYLLDLLGEDALIAVETVVRGCDSLTDDPLALRTLLKVVAKADVNTLEEVFYNIIYDLRAAPLHVGCLLQPPLPVDIEAVISGFSDLKPDALREQAQARSDEAAWLFERVADLLELGVSQDRIREGLAALGIELNQTPEEVTGAHEQEKAASNAESLSEQDTAQAIAILQAQGQVLASPNAIRHVPGVVCRVAAALGQPCTRLPADEAETRALINGLLTRLGAETVSEASEVVQSAPRQNLAAPRTTASPKSERVSSPGASKAREGNSQTQHHAVPKTVKIDQSAIDELMDVVGELLVVKNALPFIAERIENEQARRDLLSKYEQLNRMVSQLQDRVMDMRLLPLSYIFSRYPKLVRDISRKLGKKIRYEEQGGDTKLDKMMIEQLADPMIHIIRNALDHGLETPEERRAAGKPEEGVLQIQASNEGGRVIIEISDDGRGIDVDRVVQKALEKGLVTLEAVERMSEEEKLGLIFLPGLSTKEEISDLSGRGVGADAVLTTVESLGGRVTVSSERGKGTTVRLILPVSVALTSVFHVEMGGQNYAIDMEHIVETEKIAADAIKTAAHQPLIQVRDELVPLLQLPALLKRDALEKEESVLIVNSGERKIALVVDRFIGQLDVVQKPLSGPLQGHPLISGVALLGDGSPLFILNVSALVEA